MKSVVYIALVVFLGTIAVQGYGPKIERKKHGALHKSSHRSNNKPPHGSHHGPPRKPHHHGLPQRPNHLPSHDHSFRPPDQHGRWDNAPVWDDRSDSRDSDENSGSYGSYDRDDSYGPEDSYSDERDSPNYYGSSSSYEDYNDWYGHHHTQRPCHNKRPPKTTRKPIPRPIPTSPRPIQTSQRPTTHRIPPLTNPTLPPHPAHTRFTPNPTKSTEAVRPNPTTPQTIPRPTRTVGPIHTITPVSRPTRSTWHPWTTPTVDTTHWETTTHSVPETTTSTSEVETTTEEGFTTISPEIRACIESCLSTPEYNPVCGSNGQTFDNEGKLFCASSCGINVTLRRRSVCPPPVYDDYDEGGETSGSPPTTITTTESNLARSTPFSKFTLCMRQCRITATFAPVCGSDLVTYMNMDRLKCAQSCGEVVEVLCEKPCAACGFNPVTPRTTTTLPPPTTPYIGRSTQEPDVQECINACPVTSEHNPVCGTNHITYRNPSHLICSQLCGDGVAVVHLGPCGPTTTTSTTTESLPPTLSPDVLSCIRRCPVTSEFDPVCGTDDLTYNNLGNLHCSRFCGVSVELKHKSRCLDEFDLEPDGTDSSTSRTTQNINGNKDYVTPSTRNTATATLFTSRTTTTTETPTATPTMTPASTITPTSTTASDSSSTLGFTIPSDVLVDIFGSTTTQTPITKPTNPDEDEDINLDARFSNETDQPNDTGRGHYSKIIFPE